MYFRPDYNIDMESVLQSVATDVLLLLPEDVDEQIVTNIWQIVDDALFEIYDNSIAAEA